MKNHHLYSFFSILLQEKGITTQLIFIINKHKLKSTFFQLTKHKIYDFISGSEE